MSHFSTLRTKITDAEILKVSCATSGLPAKRKPMSGATTDSVFALTWLQYWKVSMIWLLATAMVLLT